MHHNDNGCVVGIRIFFYGSKNRKRCISKCICISNLTVRCGQTFILHRVPDFLCCFIILLIIRKKKLSDPKLRNNDRSTADMIRIRMRQYKVIEIFHALFCQIELYLCTLIAVTGINQHGMPATL